MRRIRRVSPSSSTFSRLVSRAATGALLVAVRLRAQPLRSPMPDTVREYVSTAMTAFRTHSVHQAEVDWRSLEDSVVARAGDAQTPAGTWAALTGALRSVDAHSFLIPPAPTMAAAGWTAPPAARPAPGRPVGRLLDGQIALITVRSHSGLNRPAYVDSLQSAIGALDRAGACGWVVDLREDTGGNMWPMLAGVGPLLGAEVVGSFTNTPPGAGWRYRGGRSWSGDSIPPAVPDGFGSGTAPRVANGTGPVALLTGRNTASSGEMILLAFLGRPHVRSFGDSTAGYTSANTNVPLRDGATLVVTSAYPRDRQGHPHPLSVAPDELVASTDRAGDDAPLRRAVAWLGGQRACAVRGRAGGPAARAGA